MAVKNYQWKTDASIISGGYPGEETGVINGTTDWQTTSALTGSTSESYYFRDSDYMDNSRSSRVVVTITESWTASISSRNYLTITLQTTINSIVRDDIRGAAGTAGRNMFARREDGGSLIWSTYNDNINSAHTILGTPITLDSYTFTLAPGEQLSRGSVFFRSNVTGHDGDGVPSAYVDLMWLGTHFRNILPKETVPHAVLGPNSQWLSHNRDGGDLRLWNGSRWTDNLPNVGGGEDYGDPPSVLKNNKWLNARTFGKQ